MHRWINYTAKHENIVLDQEFNWTQRDFCGEEFEPAVEDDRQSCNVSQTSMESTGDAFGTLKAPMPGNWAGKSSGAEAGTSPNATSAKGPLSRNAMQDEDTSNTA